MFTTRYPYRIEQRQALLRTIVKSQLKALSEIAHNVINGSVILSPSDKNKLKKCKRVLSVLGRKLTKRWDKLKALHSKTVPRSSIERRKFSTMEKMIEWCVTTLRSGVVLLGVGLFVLARLWFFLL
jgi:hypothetical protein